MGARCCFVIMNITSKTQTKLVLRAHRGFALVVSLSMMILLVIVAVGLLSLSAVSLRTASQEESMRVARDNARLALMIALGELQKAAGPDQRITAPVSLVDESGSPAITGVWQSWVPDGQATDYTTRKQTNAPANAASTMPSGNFVTWLASGGNSASPANNPTNPPGVAAGSQAVTLMTDRSGPDGTVRGVHLERTHVGQNGAMAWTVIDEGIKARMDLPYENEFTDETREPRLRAPGRPQPEAIASALGALRADELVAPKLVSLSQGGYHLGDPQRLRSHVHDLTPHATSLFTNVAEGGLKGDLTRAFEAMTLPAELNNRYLFSHNNQRLVPSDPSFKSLASYYQLHRQNTGNLQVRIPNRYEPISGSRVNLTHPDEGIVAPVVTRVSLVFSLVSRTAPAPWAQSIAGFMGHNEMTKMVFLTYTPAVTVYNPYSVPLEFNNLKVNFRNIPVAFKFFRNGRPLQNRHALLSTLHLDTHLNENWDDPFGVTISNVPGAASTNIVLNPGEARVFGVCHDTDASWSQMFNALWQGNLSATKTTNVFAGPGWDYRSGYVLDLLLPEISDVTQEGRRVSNNTSQGIFPVRPTDTINVEVMPRMPGSAGGRFSVEIEATTRSNRPAMPIGAYSYVYRSEQALQDMLREASIVGNRQVDFPFKIERDLAVGPGQANSIFLPGDFHTPIRDWGSQPRPFAIFSLTARTANDSLYPGKPGITSSFVHNVLEMDAGANHPALLPMEMQLLPITGAGANVAGSIEADVMDRAFYFSGLNRGSGAISYVSSDIPRNPLVNLADLRHANLANSGHLPLTHMTIGESLASPFVSSDRMIETNTSFGYAVPDHAWHANNKLWDHYFFSGIRNASDATLLFGGDDLPLNPRLTPLPAPGASTAEAVNRTTDQDSWKQVASVVGLRGGFNVNSTSVAAWKAVLSSLREAEVPVLGPVEINVDSSDAAEQVVTANGTAIPRQSRPISGAVNRSNHQDNTLRWSGFRELDDGQIDRLAREIVNEVRARGPFLSMAEFVNRRIGTGDTATSGALETAIRRAAINDEILPGGGRLVTADQAANFGYANPAAAAGSVEEGAAGMIRQGDLLSAIGSHITVRSDTFVIRGYGEARSGDRVTARAWCEAVVQRVPGFVDPADAPDRVVPAAGRGIDSLNDINRRFGRRFEVVSFQWLHSEDV